MWIYKIFMQGLDFVLRDLCSKSLTIDGLHMLEQNIHVIICNLENIFTFIFQCDRASNHLLFNFYFNKY